MKLNCIKCAAEIPAENMNLDRMVAKCAVCNSVFSFEDELGGGRVTAAVKRLDAPQPQNVRVENWGGQLTIQWRWFTLKIVLATIFALFWNGMMFSLVGSMITDIPERGLEAVFPFIFFPHIWVGFYLIYYVLAGYINQTRMIVDGQTIRIQHGPLPWIGNKTLDSSDVVQLYTKQHRGRNNWGGTYQLHAVADSDKHEKLLSGLEDSEHALFVEQEVERFLGIEDRPVRGEYGRG